MGEKFLLIVATKTCLLWETDILLTCGNIGVLQSSSPRPEPSILSSPQMQTADNDKLRASDVSPTIMAGRGPAEHNSSFRGQGWNTPKNSNHLLPPVRFHFKLPEPPKIASMRGTKPSMQEHLGISHIQASAPTSGGECWLCCSGEETSF